ncbi:MAG: PA14 domain-containing protein, partial [Candidatus Anammoxibacter sp.]
HPGLLKLICYARRYANLALLCLAVLSVAFSLIVRVVYRGAYYPGWDVLGPAHGLYLVSTQSFGDAFSHVFHSVRHFQYWNHTNSLLYTMIPGYMGTVWPWEYWGHLLTFAFSAITMWLIIKIADIPLKSSWILFLALGSSPVILSFSVTGYPYITGFLPHALAIWIVLNKRIYKSWLLTLFLCLVINELSWNLYELGKTVFTVFLAAAIMRRNVPLATRAAWIVTSFAQIFMLWKYSGGNVGFFTNVDQPGVDIVWSAFTKFVEALFVLQRLDIPVLFITGIISLFFFKRDKWFLFVLFLAQVGLVLLLAVKGSDMLRPRRFLMVECYCVVLVVCMFRESGMTKSFWRISKIGIVCLLIFGSVWQLLHLLHYVEKPVYTRRHPMPFTYSQADYFVQSAEVNWCLEMRSRVDSGEKLILVYNLLAYPENSTDPAGVLERLYLYLGHDRFMRSVFVFGSKADLGYKLPTGAVQSRYSCVPVRPLHELEDFLDGIRQDGVMRPEMFTCYYLQHQHSDHKTVFASDAAMIFEEIRKRFAIKLESPKEAKFMRFKIAEKILNDRYGQDVAIETDVGEYVLSVDGATQTKPFSWRVIPLELIWVEGNMGNSPYLVERPWYDKLFSLKFSGTLHIFESGLYDFILGADDDAFLSLDGQVIVVNSGRHGFQLAQRSLELKEGRYPFELAYTDLGGISHLLVDVNRIDQASFPRSKDKSLESIRIDKLFPDGLSGRYYQSNNWLGKSKVIGKEIYIKDSLEAVWTTSPGLSQKPWDVFSLRLEGTMVITEPGNYRFQLGSDDGSLLYIDDELVIDNGGNHAYQEKNITLHLKAGKFAVRLDYFDIMADARLLLKVQRYKPLEFNHKPLSDH